MNCYACKKLQSIMIKFSKSDEDIENNGWYNLVKVDKEITKIGWGDKSDKKIWATMHSSLWRRRN